MNNSIRNILNEIKKKSYVSVTTEMLLFIIDELKNKNITSDDISMLLDGPKKPKKDDPINKIFSEITEDDEYVIVNPNSKNKNAHVLFGGSRTNPSYSKNGANMNAMKSYVKYLKPYTSQALIVITHHINTLSNVEKYLKDKYDANVTSIAGFSQGGKEVWKHANNTSLNIVGLLDPSTYNINLNLGPNTYLICNPNNWGSSGFYGETKKKLSWYCKNQDQTKYEGKIECVKINHMGIVPYFYSKYSNML